MGIKFFWLFLESFLCFNTSNFNAFLVFSDYILINNKDEYVGLFKFRHTLNDTLRNGSGHIGYGISSRYRGKGYATQGLKLCLSIAKSMNIDELYLSCNKSNPASLKVQQNNGAYIHHESDSQYFTRIPLSKEI